ncbi:MAG: RsmD family RNA methyltransferase [Opitutales bacterium]|nr:RsmD family RNA methyltransferase [Opitutales bacterium]
MRVTGGIARGIELLAPKGGSTRPATDRMREAVFSSLAERVDGAKVVDLFAGSGAYGLEAWSRGASGVVFVENHPRLAGILTENIARVARSLGAEPPWPARVRRADALGTPDEPGSADIVFVDPPYALLPGIGPEVFQRAGDWLGPAGGRLLVFEAPGELEPGAPGWTLLRRLGKGRGQPVVSVFRLGDE